MVEAAGIEPASDLPNLLEQAIICLEECSSDVPPAALSSRATHPIFDIKN